MELVRHFFRNRNDIWSFLNVAGRFTTKLVSVGLLVKALPETELAAWYIFTALFGLSLLLEGGGTMVITRQVAARRGSGKGLTAAFVQAIIRIYYGLALFIGLFAFLAGSVWLYFVAQMEWSLGLQVAWLLFVLANTLGLLAKVYGAVVQGRGDVANVQRVEFVASWLYLAVFLGLWLIMPRVSLQLPVLAMLGQSFYVWKQNRHLLQRAFSTTPRKRAPVGFTLKVAYSLIGETGSMLLIMVSFQLLTSAFVLLLSAYESPEILASFGLTMQLINIALSFSTIWMTSSFPMLASMRGNLKGVQVVFARASTKGLGLLVFVLLAIFFFAEPLLCMLGSQTSLLPIKQLFVVLCLGAIEGGFAMVGSLLISQGRASYVATVSLAFSVFMMLGAFVLFSLGMGLLQILLYRMVLALLAYGVPLFWYRFRKLGRPLCTY